MTRGVIFDLDGTLHDRQGSVVALARDQYARFPELQTLPIDEYVDLFMRLDNWGYTPKPEVYRDLAAQLGLSNALVEVIRQDYRAAYSRFAIGFPGLIPMLEERSTRGIKLGLITNGREGMQRGKIVALDIEQFFSSILISEAVGIKKPAPEIYRQCLQELAVSAEEAVMVGDHPELDVAGAQRVGLKAIWFVDPHWGSCAHADATVCGLEGLPEIIDRLPQNVSAEPKAH